MQKNWFQEFTRFRKSPQASFQDEQMNAMLQPFQQFLNKPMETCKVLAAFCITRGRRGSTQMIYEMLELEMPHQHISLIIEDLFVEGWIEMESDGPFSSGENWRFTHQAEVAIKTSNSSIFPSSANVKEENRLMQMYARAVNFKNRNIDCQSWIQQCDEWVKKADTPMLKTLKRKKLDRLNNGIALFVGVIYMMDEQSIELNWMIQIFSKNNLESMRMRQEMRTPEFQPVKQGVLSIDVSPRGSVFLFPSNQWLDGSLQQKKSKQALIKLPGTLKPLKYQDIHPCTLFYNPDVDEQIEMIKNLLEPKAFTSYKQSMKKKGQMQGVTILLSGGPGTGKTELAKQIALKTKRNLLFFDVAEQRNMFYGESEKKIAEVFNYYEKLFENSTPEDILFFNEADSVIQNRSIGGTNTHQTEVAIQTLLLNALENFKGILIATTNRPESFDKAFKRRFLFHIEINQPQEMVRMKLLQDRFPALCEETAKELATMYTFTGAELEVFTRHWQIKEIVKNKSELTASLEEFLQKLSGGIKRVKKPIGFQWY